MLHWLNCSRQKIHGIHAEETRKPWNSFSLIKHRYKPYHILLSEYLPKWYLSSAVVDPTNLHVISSLGAFQLYSTLRKENLPEMPSFRQWPTRVVEVSQGYWLLFFNICSIRWLRGKHTHLSIFLASRLDLWLTDLMRETCEGRRVGGWRRWSGRQGVCWKDKHSLEPIAVISQLSNIKVPSSSELAPTRLDRWRD